MKKTGKLLALVSSAALLLGLTAGCTTPAAPPSTSPAASGGNGEISGTIRMLTHFDQAKIDAIKGEFEAQYGVTVEVDTTSFEELNDTYEVLLSSGSSEYDVLVVDGPNAAAYVSRGYLAPLDEYFTKDQIGAFSGALVNQGTVDGKFYAAPLGDSCTVMYYNKDLLAQSGIDWDWSKYDGSTRITWEELIDLANRVVDKLDPERNQGFTPIEFGQVGQVYMMNTIPNSLGGANISEDGLSVAGILDSKPWTDALTWYQENVENGTFSRGVHGFDGYNNFYAGKTPFIMMTTDSYGYCLGAGMKPESIGWTYVPAFKGYEDKVTTACGNWAAAVNANSANKAAAATFVNWITYGSGNELFLQQETMVPNMASRFSDAIYAINPVLEIASKESGKTSVVRAVTPGFNEYATAMDALWEDVRNGADVSASVTKTITDIDSAMQVYKK